MWKPVGERLGRNLTPTINLEGFSFLDNPVRTMEQLTKIIHAETTARDARLNFMDKFCLDIGSYLVLGAANRSMAPVFSHGAIRMAIAKVVEAVQLRELFGMAKMEFVREYSDVWAFPLRSRRPAGTSESETRHLDPQSFEKVGDDLVEAINGWLGESQDYRLTRSGRGLVKKIVGEVLCNAERHSSLADDDDGDWSIAGFMALREKGTPNAHYRVHLAFLSVGRSISETMSRASVQTKSKMKTYSARHMHRLVPSGYTDENLNTVFAIQDGVTSVESAEADGRGGTGFQDILEFFNGLASIETGEENAQLAIVSGKTCVSIKNPYYQGIRQRSDARELWFNPENDPTKEPDKGYVVTLPSALNGTLVTMAFNLMKMNLENAERNRED